MLEGGGILMALGRVLVLEDGQNGQQDALHGDGGRPAERRLQDGQAEEVAVRIEVGMVDLKQY